MTGTTQEGVGATSLFRERLRLPRPTMDTVIPLAAVTSIFTGLYALSLLRWYTLLGSYDSGYYRQAAWLITSGKEPFISMRGLHLLGDHAVYLFYPIAWLIQPLPAIPALLGLQAAALALGALPLWAFSRRVAGLGIGAATVLLVAYGLYPALHNINLFDFHPEVVAVPALLGAALFGITGRWLPYGACVAVVLLSKEDLAVVVVGLGVLLLLEHRPRAGAITIGLAAGWLLLNLAVVMPHFAGGELAQAERLSQYGDSVGEVTTFVLGHPLRVAADYASGQNLAVLVGLFAPLCFLPLLSPKWLLPGLPLQLYFLQANVPAAHTIEAQYTVGVLGFVFLATAMSLSRTLRGTNSRTVLGIVLIASVFFNMQLSNGSPNRRPWGWRARDAVDQARLAADRFVPPRAAVSSSVRMWPLLADRPELYNFPMPFERYTESSRDPVPLEQRRKAVRYVVLDTADPVQWSADLEEARRTLLPQLGFTPVFSRNGIFVYTR
jgi:uncharacterized membrane protein